MIDHLFVYGTLMQNHDNPYTKLIRKNSSLVGKAFIYAKKYNLGACPGIKLSPDKEFITHGELYYVKTNLNQVIRELDYYEGYNPENIQESLFIRKEVFTYCDKVLKIKAWVYEYAKETKKNTYL